MKRNLLFLVSLLWLSSFTWAQQTPKWVEKAKRAVISVVTYDDQERIIGTSNGFLVSDDGVAVVQSEKRSVTTSQNEVCHYGRCQEKRSVSKTSTHIETEQPPKSKFNGVRISFKTK